MFVNKILEFTPQVAIPIVFIVGGLVLGYVFEKIVLLRMKSITAKTKWKGDDIVVESLSGMFITWFVLGGIYGAFLNIPAFEPQVSSLIEKVLIVLFIASGTVVLAKIAVGLVDLYAQKIGGYLHASSIFTNLTRIIVFVVGVLIILQTFGISITPILTALGVGGLAVALALQDTLSNLFSGLHIVASRQVRPGDYVELESGEKGYVVDINWRNTTIRALPNNMIVIPNQKMASTIVTNYNKPEKEMAVLIQVGVAYGSDLEKVEKVTVDAGKKIMNETAGGIAGFEPFIRYHTFGDSSIQFTVILRCKEFVDQYLVKHEFVKLLHKFYKEEGIEIPFPIRTVYMKNS